MPADLGYGSSSYGVGTFSREPGAAPYPGYGVGLYGGGGSYGKDDPSRPIRLRTRVLMPRFNVRIVTETI